MRKRSKNGFTIVELVIVIAVIGILTAILIPLFVNLGGKAQEADNQSFVRNINTQLAMNEADKGSKNAVMEDSIKLAQDIGFDVTKITPYNNNDIVWDSVHDRFAILKSDYAQNKDKKHVVYADASFDVTTPLYQLWKVYGSYENNPQTYSIYAKETTSWDNVDIDNLKVGFDAGKNAKINSIRYVGSGNPQNTVIRTNGGTLTVDAAKDTVSHFGFATVVNCNDVKVGTYNESGTVGRLIYSDNEGAIYFGSTAVVYCYMNTSSDATANLSNDIKATKATIYTNVQSGGNPVVYKGKTVTVTDDGLVDVSACENHNDDYGIIKLGDVTYVVCKCCGGFSKYSVDSEGHLVTENGDGVSGDNSFNVDNSDLGLNVVEEPNYVISCDYYDNDNGWTTLYFTSLEEALAASKESEESTGEYLEFHLLCDLEVNTVFALAEVGQTYASGIYLDEHTLSGNLFLNGTTLTFYDGTVTANIYLNDSTKGDVTQNCALHLGTDYEDDGTYHPVTATGTITLNGKESSLTINPGSSAPNVVNNGGHVY